MYFPAGREPEGLRYRCRIVSPGAARLRAVDRHRHRGHGVRFLSPTRTLKPLLTFVLADLRGGAPWLIFTTLYYGSPIPNTVIAKTLGYPGYWETAPSFRWAAEVRGTGG